MTGDLWTADDAAAATGGTAHGDWTATGVSIDSRTVAGGDLFIALKGPNFDGHDYVASALDAGAAAAMVETGRAGGGNAVEVADTFEGLNALGAAGRARMDGRVIAITGMPRKTTTRTSGTPSTAMARKVGWTSSRSSTRATSGWPPSA